MKKFAIRMLIVCLFPFTVASCNDDEGETTTKEYHSQAGDKFSHNAGQACMSCHGIDGNSEILFSTAGTIYEHDESTTADSAQILLRNERDGQGEVLLTLSSDNYGNFYTTKVINYSQGLYPHVIATDGRTNYMPSAATTGNCNGCHDGTSAPRINLSDQ